MGKIFATAFLGNEDCTFYDNALAMCAQLGHPSMASLMEDCAHWCQFGKALDAQLAVVLTWLDKKVEIIHMYSITAGLCDTSKGHRTRTCRSRACTG